MNFVGIGHEEKYHYMVNIEMICCVQRDEDFDNSRPFQIKVHTNNEVIIVEYKTIEDRESDYQRITYKLGLEWK